MTSMNERAYEIARRMETEAESLDISIERLDCGATVIDAGVHVSGSYEAGKLFAETCMSGLGKVHFDTLDFDDFSLPSISVVVSHPTEACMASQYAGWSVAVPINGGRTYRAMGSGPARALYGNEALLKKLGITEEAEVAVLALESARLPDDTVAAWIAEKCGVSPEQVVLLVAPTASLVGSVQVAARVVETGMHKMVEVGFDIRCIQSGFGVCPIAPVAQNDLQAIGRTNDAVLYGSQAWYTARTGPDIIEAVIDKLPSSTSRDYGMSFNEIFLHYDCDFYKIDPLLFSPAEIFIQDLGSGRSFHAGLVNPGILKKSLLT